MTTENKKEQQENENPFLLQFGEPILEDFNAEQDKRFVIGTRMTKTINETTDDD